MPKSKEDARKTRDVDFVAKGQEMIDEDQVVEQARETKTTWDALFFVIVALLKLIFLGDFQI